MRTFRLALAQINTVVGDLSGNTAKILTGIEQARGVSADLVVFPELAVPGYPPEDLLLKTDFIHANRRALDQVVQASSGLTVVVGFVDANSDIYNAAAICHDGALAGIYHKHYLPNYSVFDEDRYFQA
ncbi:MAG: NAD+ synthase, partial [Chloroflexi bacterium]|nr:NAD+ synthase [Chloroflexota bacterium]